MKSEIFTITLLRISLRAQKLIVDLLGSRMSSMEFNPFLYLAHPNAIVDLGYHFQCQPESGFSRLAERITQDILEKNPSTALTRKHMLSLSDQQQTVKYLTRILHCEQSQVYDELFDIPKILDYIYTFAPQTVKKWLSNNLQSDAIVLSGNLVVKYLIKENVPRISDREWGRLLDEKLWLRSSALTMLRGTLADHGYGDTTDSKVLATVIDESYYFEASDEIHLDSLAILHIKRQIAWIVRQMNDHAIELLEDALKTSSSASALVDLKRHIDFYELKHPASVWHSLFRFNFIENKEALRDLQIKFPITTFSSTGAKGIPQIGTNFITRHENRSTSLPNWQFWRNRKNESRVIVSCKLIELQEPVDVLICETLNPLQVEPLMQLFSKLRFINVENNIPIEIGQFILSQSKPWTQHDWVSLLLSKFQSGIVHGLIMAGTDIPTNVAPVWEKALSYEIPIRPWERHNDTRFPVKRRQILQDIQKSYQNANLKIVDNLDE